MRRTPRCGLASQLRARLTHLPLRRLQLYTLAGNHQHYRLLSPAGRQQRHIVAPL